MTTRTRRTTPNRLAEAMAYLRHGLHPIPIRPHDKRPALAAGEIQPYRQRPPTEAELRRWFGAGRPRNLGLVTGPDAGGLVIIDVDGPTGEASLRGKLLPPTPTVLTPRPGRHLYYYAGEAVPSGELLSGVDILAEARLVVAPTSVHRSGAVYRWAPGQSLDDLPIARLPGWVIAILDGEAVENQPNPLNLHANAKNNNVACTHPHRRTPQSPPTPPQILPTYTTVPSDCLDLTFFVSRFGEKWGDIRDACARYIMRMAGRPADVVGSGQAFRCILPGHGPDRSPSASWRLTADGALLYRDWHTHAGQMWYSPAEVYAAIVSGRVTRLPRPSRLTWWLRLLVDVGFLWPADVRMPAIPDNAPPSVRQLCEGFRRLLAAKWVYQHGQPTMFSRSWAAAWCGMQRSTAHGALQWALAHGIIRIVGYHRGMPLYLPGPHPQSPRGQEVRP
ncbi:MAG TPA: bifunctional DNA primase/polymerase [Alphaproteobacteria bacterium]|nr:bifunctional DNA primase/polymerase [Alphaproteobacteria bacterium]